MLSNLEFFIVEAFRSFRRSALISMVTVATVTVSLTVFGLFLLLIFNLGNIVGVVSSRLDLVAYVSRDLSLEDAAAIQVKISKISGVEKVEFTSKEDAWKKMRQDFGSKLALDEVIRENPLPHAFAVRVRTPELLPVVAKEISQIEVVDEVRYSGKLIDQIKSLIDGLRIGGMALVLLLFFATFLIVVNTIRLTVLAREADISIMKLVGATNTFVKWPFIIEGLLLGMLGGIASFLILKFSYEAVVIRLAQALPFLPLIEDKFFLNAIYLIIVLGGVFLGMFAAYFSVSRVLKSEG